MVPAVQLCVSSGPVAPSHTSIARVSNNSQTDQLPLLLVNKEETTCGPLQYSLVLDELALQYSLVLDELALQYSLVLDDLAPQYLLTCT